MVLGPLVVVVLVAWLAGFSGPARHGAWADAAWVLLTSSPPALIWLGAAFGWGWPVRRWLLAGIPDAAAAQMGLGAATLLTLDAALGATGALQWGGGAPAWIVLAAGLALVAGQWFRERPRPTIFPWPVWAAAPALAALLLAACSAPGWLWSTEFGGYDALSYHLQLPKEWQTLGCIVPLDHNVYSYLPGYVEAAYYHLAVLAGDGIASVYACQLLHAGFAVLTAAVVGRLAWRVGGRIVGAVAFAIVLGTPWTVVVGSLGYNEMAVTLFLATGLLVIHEAPPDSTRRGAAVGLLAAAACGAKLTAIGFVAAPLVLLLLAAVPPKRWAAPLGGGAAAALLILAPYLVRNWLACGNPLFPFATGLLGLGHWTQQQADVWTAGHMPHLGVGARIVEAWQQLFRFGLGPAPNPKEPWEPQWSLLPWLAAGGLVIGMVVTALRPVAWRLGMVIVVQILFWTTLTHIKSRFMLPAVVPAGLAAAIGLGAFGTRMQGTVLTWFIVAFTAIWSVLPLSIFVEQRNHAPAAMVGWVDVLTGDGLSDRERVALAEAFPAVDLNYGLGHRARTLLVGDAAPLYYRADIAYQTTWDRGPLSEIMRETDDPQQWLTRLRARGFTHLLVDPQMLELWSKEGWNDPLITAQRVLGAAERFATLEREFPGGVRLYRLPGNGPAL
jgi:hypothetical protein